MCVCVCVCVCIFFLYVCVCVCGFYVLCSLKQIFFLFTHRTKRANVSRRTKTIEPAVEVTMTTVFGGELDGPTAGDGVGSTAGG